MGLGLPIAPPAANSFAHQQVVHRGTPPIKKTPTRRTYSRAMPRLIWRSSGGGAVSHERGIPVAEMSQTVPIRVRLSEAALERGCLAILLEKSSRTWDDQNLKPEI